MVEKVKLGILHAFVLKKRLVLMNQVFARTLAILTLDVESLLELIYYLDTNTNTLMITEL